VSEPVQTSPQSAGEVAQQPAADEDVLARRPLLRRLLAAQTLTIFVALLLIIAVFAGLRWEQFATASNLRNVATDASVLLVIAVGMTFVILTAGIDLSVGAVLVFASAVSAMAMGALGGEGWTAAIVGLLVALAAGLGWGVLNGTLIAKARITPLIVTLGTLGMAQGAALLLTGGINKRDVPLVLVTNVGVGRVFDAIPYLVLIAAGVTAVAAVTLTFTRFGRYTYAIGSNAEAARRAGIDVDRHLIKVYAISGLLAGLAGYLSLARFATTTLSGHATDNLQAIAAVVIGGTSLFGGIGNVLGTVVGVFIPAVLQNGFIIMRVQPFWQQVAVGAVLIAAVYIDQLKRRSRELE
jgi:ribose transport system permease protein